jgi:hypothetical protein
MQKKKRRGWLGTILLAAILATAAFAYTTSIQGLSSAPQVGAGASGAFGDYTVSGISWSDDGATGVTAVDFDIAPAASSVRVNVTNPASWVPCTMSVSNTHAHCALSVDATNVTQLDAFAKN